MEFVEALKTGKPIKRGNWSKYIFTGQDMQSISRIDCLAEDWETEPEQPDTMNIHCVGSHGDDIVFVRPVKPRLTHSQALNLAAWIVAMADPSREKFEPLYKAILNT